MESLTERILRRKTEYKIMGANYTESTKRQQQQQKTKQFREINERYLKVCILYGKIKMQNSWHNIEGKHGGGLKRPDIKNHNKDSVTKTMSCWWKSTQ